ncbi:MAG: hypothetical protein KF901_14455 [Myxococcales bacterium]|nr:hypothetical protein [Myxococcales bacterium]
MSAPRTWSLTRFFLVALAFACSDQTVDYGVEERADDSDTWGELRRRMNITILSGDKSQSFTKAPHDFLWMTQFECARRLNEGEVPLDVACGFPENVGEGADVWQNHQPSDCHQAACIAQLQLCMTHLFLETVQNLGTDLRVEWAYVPPQSQPAKAALSELAIEMAQRTIALSVDTLRAATSREADATCLFDDLDEPFASGSELSDGEVIGAALQESYRLLREATDRALDANLAVSDADAAREGSTARGARRAYHAPVLSRGHAIELLYGVPPIQYSTLEGLPDRALRSEGFAPVVGLEGPTTPNVRKAVEFFRFAAIAPADVLDDDLSTDDLVAGLSVPAEGSLAVRLGAHYGIELPSVVGDVYDFLGLSRAEFESARRLLRQELVLFERDPNVTIPVAPGIDDTFARYAATATPATEIPGDPWPARALFSPEVDEDRYYETSFSNSQLPTSYAYRSVAAAMDFAISGAIQLMQGWQDDLPSEIRESFAGLLREADDRPARIEVDQGNMNSVTIRVLGVAPADLLLVAGGSGIRCALTGVVEGQTCDLSNYVVGETPTAPTVSPEYGFASASEVVVQNPPSSSDPPTTVHVVTANDPSRGFVAGNTTAVGSVTLLPDGGPIPELATPVSSGPWISARGDRVARRDPTRPGPVNDCAGIDANTQRVPLENELSEDFDPVESSWRTYLHLARRAADEADELGRQVLEVGLSADMRAEAAMDALEDECGTAVDLDWLSVERGADYGGPCPCTHPFVCNFGVCTVDPVRDLLSTSSEADDENTGRLRACLDPDGTQLVSLGTRQVCVWRSETNPNDLCNPEAAPSEDWRCPFFLDDYNAVPGQTTVGGCGGVSGLDAGYEVIPAEPLELFQSDPGAGGGGGNLFNPRELCRSLRIIRSPNTGENSGSARARVNDSRWSDVFAPEYARLRAENIGFEARPGTHARLTRGGTGWLVDTGFLSRTNLGTWPCNGPMGEPSTPPGAPCSEDNGSSGARGLFCQPSFDCSNESLRASFAARLGRAVVASRIVTGANLRNIVMPHAFASMWITDCPSRDFVTDDGSPVSYGMCKPDDAKHVAGTTWRRESLSPRIWLSNSSARNFVPNSSMFFGYNVDSSEVSRSAANVFMSGFHGRPLLPERDYRAPGYGGERFPNEGRIRSVYIPLIAQSINMEDEPFIKWFHDRTSGQWDRRLIGEYYARLHNSNSDKDVNLRMQIDIGGLSTGAMRDGMELLCEAGVDAGAGVAASCGAPPEINSVDDLSRLSTYMGCAANVLEHTGERMVFADVPDVVVNALKNPGGVGSYPSVGGRLGVTVTRVRDAMQELPAIRRSVAFELRQFAQSIRQMENQIKILGLEERINNLNLMSTISSQIASCSSSAVSASGVRGAISAAITCANSVVQIAIAVRVNALTDEIGDTRRDSSFSAFMEQFNAAQERIELAIDRLIRTQETINGGLAELDGIRRRAQRAVSDAVFADSDAQGRVNRVSTVMRRRMNTLEARYERARTYAVRMASLARLAIEQRLGFRLEDYESAGDHPLLVEHPRSWARAVCSSTGIDYRRIRDTALPEYENFSDAFIGDYVRKLEAFVESYRVERPFSDGTDTSVVSLRDEILNVRSEDDCYPRTPRNLLADGTAMQLAVADEEESPPWVLENCPAVEDPLVTEEDSVVNCVGILPLAENPLADAWPRPSNPLVWRIGFGPPDDRVPASTSDPSGVDEGECSARASTRLAQAVELGGASVYQVSWYGRVAGGCEEMMAPASCWGPAPEDAVEVVDDDGVPLQGTVASHALSDGWARYWAFFATPAVDEPFRVRLRIVPRLNTSSDVPAQAVELGGFLLERLELEEPDAMDVASHPPRIYQDPNQRYSLCEDTEGHVFRSRDNWRGDCINVCPVAETSCPAAVRVNRCYWETSFTITQADIDQQRMIHTGGFARGNFNYRVESLGLNFVGTGLRDCSDAPLGSTCYANGTIPFSLHHLGPFHVRNHTGDDGYEAPLFDGRIEQARGLAAERYLTNPLSGADRGLIEPFLRRELRGRPLTGRYRIRVWQEPGVRFDRLEDVQIVLNYRYWTLL